MSKPYIHAVSSAKKWGGEAENYLPLHDLMDSSKAVLSDNRHRALTHHSWFAFVAERVLGHNLLSATGRKVSTRDLVEQHLLEDFGQKFMPTAADYLIELPLKPWMEQGLETDIATEHARHSVIQFGGTADDYLALHQLMNSSQTVTGDGRHRALTHHSFFVDLVEKILGEELATADGTVPTRLVAEQHLERDLGFVPGPHDFLTDLRFVDWFNNGIRGCPPSARKVLARRRQMDSKQVFAFNLD